jgi:uncharacterized protein (DUF305 family)
MKRSALAIACALLLAGCGSAAATKPPAAAKPAAAAGSPSASAAMPPNVNATDVMFLQMMLPHHRQGIRLVRLAKDRPAREEIKILAAAIDATQSAELEMMSGWLRDWGQPETSTDPHVHDAHGGVPETSLAEIAALQKATGADFEKKFLDAMIAHQDDAVQMAKLELGSGGYQGAKDFASRVDQSRSAQVKQMLKLRDSR